MNDQYLELTLRLLIAQFGKQRVLRTLARLGDQTVEELERLLRTAEENRKEKRKESTPKQSMLEMIASESPVRPEIVDVLRPLAVAFQNRTFLPQLRDIRRFLDRLGLPVGRLRSRDDAVPVLVRALTALPREELIRLASCLGSANETGFSVLAREIMKQPLKGTLKGGDQADKTKKE